MTPNLTITDDTVTITAFRGTARLILDGALKDANLWGRAVGASQETKNHWARRASLIRSLLDRLPAPVNPRDPYEDLPGEPTPEEATRTWGERAAAEDVRRVARMTAAVAEDFGAEADVKPDYTDDDLADLLG